MRGENCKGKGALPTSIPVNGPGVYRFRNLTLCLPISQVKFPPCLIIIAHPCRYLMLGTMRIQSQGEAFFEVFKIKTVGEIDIASKFMTQNFR